MFIGKFNKSIAISYLGVVFAVIGMYYSFLHNFKFATICLVAAGVCDLFDGLVARSTKNRTKDDELFGIQLDSLADVVNFVVFPVVFGYNLGLKDWYHIVGYGLLAIAGIQRLCHFNVVVINKKDSGPVKFYTGLPVTSTSIIFPILWLISNCISSNLYHILYTVLVYLIAFFFVLNIKIPKLKGIAYPIFAVLAAAFIIIMVLI